MRVIPFSYSYGMQSVKKVFDYVLGLDYLKEHDIELKRIPKQDRKISLPRRYAQAILPTTTTIANAQNSTVSVCRSSFKHYCKHLLSNEGDQP